MAAEDSFDLSDIHPGKREESRRNFANWDNSESKVIDHLELKQMYEENYSDPNGHQQSVLKDVESYMTNESASLKASKGPKGIGSVDQISNEDLILAATLVHDARAGITMEFRTETKYVRSYNLYKIQVLRSALFLTIFINLSLALFEKPAVPGLELPIWLTLIDMSSFTIQIMLQYNLNPVRWSRLLRPLFILNFPDGKEIRRAWRNIRRTVKEILHALFLLVFTILLFALVAFKIFQTRDDIVYPDGRPYFKEYAESFWDLYVLLTASNNPDIMMPAFDKSSWFSILFAVYIIICLYLLLNIFLAVTYNSYRENMRLDILQSVKDNRCKLQQAFDVLKVNRDGQDMVTYQTWCKLIRLAEPQMTTAQIDLFMLVLDDDKSGHISKKEFMNVANLLNVPLKQVEERMIWMERKFPTMYYSSPIEILQNMIKSRYLEYTLNLIIVTHIILIALDIKQADWIFLGIFTLEIALKIFLQGPVAYFEGFVHIFDCLITVLSLAGHIWNEIQMDKKSPEENSAITFILMLRIFRIFKLLLHFKSFDLIFKTASNVFVSIVTYCAILFIIFYMYAILGMELFGNCIRYYGYNTSDPDKLFCGNPALNGSAFYALRYCKNNFNDIFSSFVILAALTVVNNWHVIAEGFVLVTSKAARLYFISFHVVTVVLVLNIITAFILDMFIMELYIQKAGKLDSVVEAKIKELGLGVEENTGMEISSPLSQRECNALHSLQGSGTLNRLKNERISAQSKKKQNITLRRSRRQNTRTSVHLPTLSRYDGTRFVLREKGFIKVEAMLQKLFETEDSAEISVHVS
ncbi:hypothetical protein ACJMK2_036984 [Sinanodonta woodiana]|uniref:EF-hand domain-containing protein n=1 Tax=Sinanodonta woodiana TaxID=1069815 RepID=A0ABD3WIV7_SINWO